MKRLDYVEKDVEELQEKVRELAKAAGLLEIYVRPHFRKASLSEVVGDDE